MTFGGWSGGRVFFLRLAWDGSTILMREDGRWSLHDGGEVVVGKSDGKTLSARLAEVDAEARRRGHELEHDRLLPHQPVAHR